MSDVGRCDQDMLNALLLSEIPREALVLLPEGEEVFGGGRQGRGLRDARLHVGRATDEDPSLRRPPEALRAIGLAVAYVLLAQLTQSLWD
jgi:hypothetical protein